MTIRVMSSVLWILCITSCCFLSYITPSSLMVDRQRYDGWFNNLANPSWGSVGDDVIHIIPSDYDDMAYTPAGSERPNARDVSNLVAKQTQTGRSYSNKTAMFAYFGQMVYLEVTNTNEEACPMDMVMVPLPDTDMEINGNLTEDRGDIPYSRSRYNHDTGRSKNNPRQQANMMTSFIDGSFIYGSGEVWANALRRFTGGHLKTRGGDGLFPAYNKIGLPLKRYPSPVSHKSAKLEDLWMTGNEQSHETPGLLSLSVTWLRYHNHIADNFRSLHPDWSDEQLYHASRRKVIAVLQNIIVYEWLPELLGEELPLYTGYKSYISPSISSLFDSVSIQSVIQTMLPSQLVLRSTGCQFKESTIRLCNAYWKSQDLLETSFRKVLLGMTSQIAEREDLQIVDDIRNFWYGPSHYSRTDGVVLSLMRGRDHGLLDYNSIRQHLGLQPARSFKDINPDLSSTNREVFTKLRAVYNDTLSHLDAYIGILLEQTADGPGQVLKGVLSDQFTRLRDGDRFWFENMQHGLFTNESINDVKSITYADVIKAALQIADDDIIQRNVFTWKQGDPCYVPENLYEPQEECTPFHDENYFDASLAAYTATFVIAAVFPFICIAIAWGIYRYNLREESRAQEKRNQETMLELCVEDAEQQKATKALLWAGKGKPYKSVELKLIVDICELRVVTAKGRPLRMVDLNIMEKVTVSFTVDKQKNIMWMKIPKGYDLVLLFASNAQRTQFNDKFTDMLSRHHHIMTSLRCNEEDVFQQAMTKQKRRQLVTRFFRAAFTHASKDMNTEDVHECKEISDCCLTREEFAEALAEPPDSLFVTQLFWFVDRDENGYMTFKELIAFIMLLTKGEYEEKLHLIFMLFDVNKDGGISMKEVTTMIQSMFTMGQSILSPDSATDLTKKLFMAARLEDKPELTIEDFKKLFSTDLFNNVSLDWKGLNMRTQLKSRSTKKKAPQSSDDSASSLRKRRSNIETSPHRRRLSVIIPPPKKKQHRSLFYKVTRYVENKKQQIFYMFLFYAFTAIVVFERVFRYMYLLDHRGFRVITGYGVMITRACAGGMCFTYALLLVTMCRNIMTYLRDTVLHHYIPFDSCVAFHKLVAWTALVFTLGHVIGYTFNLYQILLQPAQFLCHFEELVFRDEDSSTFVFWAYGTITGFTGILLTVCILILYVFALPRVRKYIFNAFWTSHKLFYGIYLLTYLHGCSRIVQNPDFPAYTLGPICLFVVDKMISLSRKKQKVKVVKSEILPSEMSYFEIQRPPNFEYKSGQWIRIACLELGHNEYHPFTLTSSPHEDTLQVYVKALGPWTWNMRRLYSLENLKYNSFSYPELYIDGPYGGSSQDWYRYDVSVLVGAGIGVTPAASVLKDFVHMATASSMFRVRCKKLYFVWVTNSQRHFEWLLDILRQVEQADTTGIVQTNIFITQVFHEYDLRTMIMHLCEKHFHQSSNISLFTGLKASTHFGRPNFESYLRLIKDEHPEVREVGVFSCGPPGLTQKIEMACLNASSYSTAFQHTYENF